MAEVIVLGGDRKQYQVLVDPDKLQRIVMNLLGNAFKFVPPGGRIRCSLRPSPHKLVISVDDSGPGVQPGQVTITQRLAQPLDTAQQSADRLHTAASSARTAGRSWWPAN